MEDKNWIEIVDPGGWARQFSLDKNICLIGSAPGNDVVLAGRGSGVDPRHLQIIHLPNQGYRLINLGTRNLLLDQAGSEVLAPRESMDVHNGQNFKLGGFQLVFHTQMRQKANGNPTHNLAPNPIIYETISDYIGLVALLSRTTINLEHPIDGTLKVKNKGDKPGVQFHVDVKGLTPDAYNLGPGPVLFPNAEKALPIRLHHPRDAQFVAGDHQLRIIATAPEAYPREETVALVSITVLPFYQHALAIESVD